MYGKTEQQNCHELVVGERQVIVEIRSLHNAKNNGLLVHKN